MVRFKNRWLLVTFSFDPLPPSSSSTSSTPTLTASDITKLLRSSLQHNFGDLGSGVHGGSIQCKYYSPALRTAIIRSARESLKYVWAAVTLITESRGRRLRTRVIHVGGTIKKVQLKAMGLDRAAINNLQKLMVEPDPPSTTTTSNTLPSSATQLPPITSLASLSALAVDEEEEDAGVQIAIDEV